LPFEAFDAFPCVVYLSLDVVDLSAEAYDLLREFLRECEIEAVSLFDDFLIAIECVISLLCLLRLAPLLLDATHLLLRDIDGRPAIPAELVTANSSESMPPAPELLLFFDSAL
jgi:hypothetical protein